MGAERAVPAARSLGLIRGSIHGLERRLLVAMRMACTRVAECCLKKKESPGHEGGTPGAGTGSCSESTIPSRELIVGPGSARVN